MYRLHDSRVDRRKHSLNAKRIEQVVRTSQLVADRRQFGEGVQYGVLMRKFGIEARDDRIRNQAVALDAETFPSDETW